MMAPGTDRSPGALVAAVLGRRESLFASTIACEQPLLRASLGGTRILVIGAAGSIGSAVVRELQPYGPEALDLVDTDENGLVDLVRAAHATGRPFPRASLVAALDFTAPEFAALLRQRPAYDLVLNFAALKHVRSESDPFTAMRMLRINALAHREIFALLAARPPRRYFVVSSDKAVRPANVLGASKALMERIGLAATGGVAFSSARFANVAFSRGSLLESFVQRLQRGEPLAGPSDIRRFFISATEAAHLCLLGCCVSPPGSIVVPAADERLPLQTFPQIAETVLAAHGLKPAWCGSAAEALARAQRRRPTDAEWPCVFTPSDTSGEKEHEEFIGPGESVTPTTLRDLALIGEPARATPEALSATTTALDRLLREGRWTRDDLVRALAAAVPEFAHRDAPASLHGKL